MPVDYSDLGKLAFLRASMAAQKELEADTQTYRDFSNGEQGVLLEARQEEYIQTDPEAWANICPRVLEIPGNRLSLTDDGIAPADDQSVAYADKATEWWQSNHLDSKQRLLFQYALRDEFSTIIVDWDATKNQPIFTPNLIRSTSEGLVRLHYDQDGELLFASKQWTVLDTLNPGASGEVRLIIYRDDLITHYAAHSGTAGGWRELTTEELGGLPNPLFWTDTGTAMGLPLGNPVIPFENTGPSELKPIIALQEFLNHNVGVLDVAIDYHAFPLLWTAGLNLPVGSDGKSTMPDFGPRQGVALPENGRMGRIEAADVKKLFEGGVLSFVQLVALVKGWPFFLFDSTQQPPSGIALTIMEAGLVAQVKAKQKMFDKAFSKMFDVARNIHKQQTGEDLPGELKFTWDDPATHDPKAEAEANQIRWDSMSVPVPSRWREAGYTELQIKRMLEDARLEDGFGFQEVQETEEE